MAHPFDFNQFNPAKDNGINFSSAKVQSQLHRSNHPTASMGQPTPQHQGNVTIYQTTGPDAFTNPILSSDGSGEPALNPRSCVTCRRRKVRCDKQMPCSNCRRALIPCIFPAPGRAPRQSRPKDPNAPPKNSSQREVELIKRLRKLEGIVEELSGQLDGDSGSRTLSAADSPDYLGSMAAAAKTAGLSAPRRSGSFERHGTNSRSPQDVDSNSEAGSDAAKRRETQNKLAKLVLNDPKGSTQYVSNAFWLKLNDELDAIREARARLSDESSDESADDETPAESPNAHPGDGSEDHHAFVMGYKSTDIDLAKLHPTRGHIEYLWARYKSNVEPLLKILHGPSAEKMMELAIAEPSSLSSSDQALVFAIYLSALVSLETEEVGSATAITQRYVFLFVVNIFNNILQAQTDLGKTKDELLSQYRFATEQALAQSDYMNTNDISVLQAFVIFLLVIRRYDSSRFCWAMTPLVIRLAQGMGIHRDGTNYGLPALEVELRRRVWWLVMALDYRGSDEFCMEFSIDDWTCDTKFPTHLNDTDLTPELTDVPEPRQDCADMIIPVIRYEILKLSRRLNRPGLERSHERELTIEEKDQLVIECHEKIQSRYFSTPVTDESGSVPFTAAILSRLIMARLYLAIHQSQMFAGKEGLKDQTRDNVYITAIESLECVSTLTRDPRCKHFRWMCLTYTNWPAMAFILLELCRRPWTALAERGWESLVNYQKDPLEAAKKAGHRAVLLPLRKLFHRARRHRTAEINRLRGHSEEVRQLAFDRSVDAARHRLGPVPGIVNRMDQVQINWQALVDPSRNSPSTPSSMFASPDAGPNPTSTGEWKTSPIGRQEGQKEQQLSPQQREGVPQPFNSMPISQGMAGYPMVTADGQIDTSSTSDAMKYLENLMLRNNTMSNDVWPMATLNPLDVNFCSPDDSQPGMAMAGSNGTFLDQQPSTTGQPQTVDNPGQNLAAQPFLWSASNSFPINPQGDDGTGEEADMLLDDFDWQNWSQGFRVPETPGLAMAQPNFWAGSSGF